MDLVFLFPGQGSQSVGMVREFYDAHESVRDLFSEGSDAIGMDLKTLCFEGPADVLIQTENVQPAITMANLAVLSVVRDAGYDCAVAAGHSLGEYSALHAAGVLSFADTLRLVHVRGRAMQEAADRHPGGMLAVIGLDVEALEGVCDAVSGTGSVEIANHNSAKQVALTGEEAALEEAAVAAKEAGAKLVIPLKVSGAWHSRFMGEAQPAMREALDGCSFGEPTVPVIANVTAEAYPADGVADLLVRQIVSPVRWASSMKSLIAAGHTTFVEVGPGKVLTGLFRDIDRDVTALSVRDPDTLAKLQETVAAG